MTQTNAGCEGCKYLLRQDTGYSNYTVTGATVKCLKNKNAALPLNDEDVTSTVFNDALAFGETCADRSEGAGPWFDCDGEVTDEEAAGGDAEILDLLKLRTSQP